TIPKNVGCDRVGNGVLHVHLIEQEAHLNLGGTDVPRFELLLVGRTGPLPGFLVAEVVKALPAREALLPLDTRVDEIELPFQVEDIANVQSGLTFRGFRTRLTTREDVDRPLRHPGCLDVNG